MGALLGRKVGMTKAFGNDGKYIPVTIVAAGPCKVLKKRTTDKDGYASAVLGFEETEGAKVKNRAKLGMFKALGSSVYRVVREFRSLGEVEAGADLTVEQFSEGDKVVVRGRSKGKGFAGAIKRWGFSRGRETHGGKFIRAIGGTGMCEFPGRVYKGRKMPGHMGDENVMVRPVEVMKVIPEENLLLVKGPLPGGKNGLLRIESWGSAKKKAAK